MQIIYYKQENGYAPAKAYLVSRYSHSEGDDKKTINNKLKRLAKADLVIKNAAENGGIARGTYSARLIGYPFQELRSSEGDDEVRILYFPYRKEKLVLLSAYDKPDKYEKAEKKKIDKKIRDTHEQTKKYYEDFLSNPNHYEVYKK
ncbi:MAG: hypothetical protein UY48_C0047G0008 [Candidatus Gottesmanbacteria bacterium GW2011_GWB1_49_7]|uniref:Uncharacterized protein n=1 Tax=Candidatus Gottesmanbacteria bacterium GW2011_GWB1_49_7 TaxID=1618448 RepID=A0A0G1Y5M0_9BACT|nr:MAG: hypothetical protein UY48_C0047G0008 [Candidatus Gottesmanbacteria bacterium GW2011_GWB1_49_7]